MSGRSVLPKSATEAIRVIRSHHGIIRTGEALGAGIHPRTLYLLRDRGVVEALSRGVYRLTELPPVSEPDLVTVALRIPQAVICLTSALAFHDMTTQMPHQISIALERGMDTPRLDYPPISVHRFTGTSFSEGIEEHTRDDVRIRVYNPEKTLADCFKFRNMLGLDVVLEGLRAYRTRRPFKADEILKYAKICRVRKVMEPYLEALA